jgi:hypothetical protein
MTALDNYTRLKFNFSVSLRVYLNARQLEGPNRDIRWRIRKNIFPFAFWIVVIVVSCSSPHHHHFFFIDLGRIKFAKKKSWIFMYTVRSVARRYNTNNNKREEYLKWTKWYRKKKGIEKKKKKSAHTST